jgi:hypothetical protein
MGCSIRLEIQTTCEEALLSFSSLLLLPPDFHIDALIDLVSVAL